MRLNCGDEKEDWRDDYNAVARDSSMPSINVYWGLDGGSTTTFFPLNLPLIQRIDVGLGKRAVLRHSYKIRVKL